MNTTTAKPSLKGLIESTNIPESLVRAVVRQMGGWESFKESAHDNLSVELFNLAYMGLSDLFHANGQPSAIYGVDVFALPELVFVEDIKGTPSGVSLPVGD